jgi:hypothetical protein
MKRIDEYMNEHYIHGDYTLESFIEKIYENENDTKKLKEILQKYNDENFQKVKDKLQKPLVKAGHNVDEPDTTEVIYSDLKKAKSSPICIFKNIIVFTGDKDPKANKTLNNIYNALDSIETHNDGVKPNLYLFDCETVRLKENGKQLIITDGDETLEIKD